MQGGYFSYALLAALATALLFAAFTDLKRREIDNWLNAAIGLAAPLWWLASGYTWMDVGLQLALALATFVVTCILFATRQMGGGDVKLLTALALWFSPAGFLQLIVLMALIGGGASVAMAFFNLKRLPGEAARNVVAGLVAVAWVWFACALVLALTTGQPLPGRAIAASVSAALPSAWMIALAALAAFAVIVFGLRHIVRRQKSRLPIPYGVAISLAGLWIVAAQAFTSAPLTALAG